MSDPWASSQPSRIAPATSATSDISAWPRIILLVAANWPHAHATTGTRTAAAAPPAATQSLRQASATADPMPAKASHPRKEVTANP
jgi:hypothetical protein